MEGSSGSIVKGKEGKRTRAKRGERVIFLIDDDDDVEESRRGICSWK